jgi:hypothetical protein
MAVIDCGVCVLRIIQEPGIKHVAGQRQNGVRLVGQFYGRRLRLILAILEYLTLNSEVFA